mgnify:CR=1 FL=1|tara:strand:- start:164 stop:295 length:132 start_codon:yes stop_codon:yes gene_type:complete
MEDRDFYSEVREIIEWWISVQDLGEVKEEIKDMLDTIEEQEGE